MVTSRINGDIPQIRADGYGIAEGAVECIVGGEIDAVIPLDGYAEDGLVVLLVDFTVAGEGKRRVADGGTRIDAREVDVARRLRLAEVHAIGVDQPQAVGLVRHAYVVRPVVGAR